MKVAACGKASLGCRPLLLAFVGGLILNLMPCVFPVLSMKALARRARRTRPRRAGRAWPSGGVLATFLALGGRADGLRAGRRRGRLGLPAAVARVVAVLAYLLLAVALNLSGVFDRDVAAGRRRTAWRRPGLAGSFFTGVLAVVVATPCTAPFMGPASASR